jgi:hypothetical protein
MIQIFVAIEQWKQKLPHERLNRGHVGKGGGSEQRREGGVPVTRADFARKRPPRLKEGARGMSVNGGGPR